MGEVRVVSGAGFECEVSLGQGDRGLVVLLHGYSFTWRVWERVGLLNELSSRGYSFIAPDMPYGRESRCRPRSRDVEGSVRFLDYLIEEFGGYSKPFLVGASLGGYIALKYAARRPVKGMVLVSPVGVRDPELVRSYASMEWPTLIIYGSNDGIVDLDTMKWLASRLPKAKLEVYDGAGHPAYLDYPKRFREDVVRLLEQAKP